MEMTAPISYFPNFISDAEQAYQELDSELKWQRHQGAFGHLVPRDEAWIAPYQYRYSNRVYPADNAWTPTLLRIKNAVEIKTGVVYDSVLCNRYRSGADSVLWHCDCEHEMSANHPIASVSFGAERVFQMRPTSNVKAVEKITLGNGSLVVMKAGMQQGWQHQVPKTSKEIGSRINLTFRVMTS